MPSCHRMTARPHSMGSVRLPQEGAASATSCARGARSVGSERTAAGTATTRAEGHGRAPRGAPTPTAVCVACSARMGQFGAAQGHLLGGVREQRGGEAIVGMHECCGRRGAARSDASRSCSRRTAQVIPDVPIVGRPAGSHDHQRRSTAVGRRRKGVLWPVDGGDRYLVYRPCGRYFVYRPPRRSREPSDRDRAAGSEPRERVTWAVGVSSAQFTSEAHKMKRGHTLSVVFAPSEHMNRRGGADGRRMEAGED